MHLARAIVTLCGAFLLIGAYPATVSGERPSDVLAATGADGVYIGAGRESAFDEARLAGIVSAAADVGFSLVIIIPATAEPTTQAFALRVRQAADVDGVMIVDPVGLIDVSFADEYQEHEPRARTAVQSALSPYAAGQAVVDEIIRVPEQNLPSSVRSLVLVAGGLLAVLVVTSLVETRLRSSRRPVRHRAART